MTGARALFIWKLLQENHLTSRCDRRAPLSRFSALARFAAAVLTVLLHAPAVVMCETGETAKVAVTGQSARPSASPASSLQGRLVLDRAAAGVLFADVDGDGREDPVAALLGPSGVECSLAQIVRKGESIGLRELAIPPGSGIHAPTLRDVDEDGTVDLLDATSDRVRMWKGRGAGSFEPDAHVLYSADDVILPHLGCASISYMDDVEGDARLELAVPVPGGVRVVPLTIARAQQRPDPGDGAPSIAPSFEGAGPSSMPGGGAPDGAHEADSHDLLSQPAVRGSAEGLSLQSPLPVSIGSGRTRIIVLGPVLDSGSQRLELSWWSLDEDGSLRGRRSSLALPPGEKAFSALPCDLEGDGRPEVVVLTAPVRLKKLLGEFMLRVYRASDTASVSVPPFYKATTNINFWQGPSIVVRPGAGGGDILIAFYRGLVSDHLTVAVYRSDGAGSFLPRPREISLDAGKSPDEGLLLWKDADGDGTVDLIAADSSGLRVHRGLADRGAPVEASPSRLGALAAPIGSRRSMSLSISGDWGIGVTGVPAPILRDLDGDGWAEAVVIERKSEGRGRGSAPNDHAISIRPLVPRSR